MCGAVRVRVRVAVSLRLLPTTTRLNGKREQRCPLRFHMSSVFENRQARCAHLRRTRQKIQFGAKDQRLFAHKGKGHTHRSHHRSAVVDVDLFFFFFFTVIVLYYFVRFAVLFPKSVIRVGSTTVLGGLGWKQKFGRRFSFSSTLLNFIIVFRN